MHKPPNLKMFITISFAVLSTYMIAGNLEPIDATGWNQDIVIASVESYNTGATAAMDDPNGSSSGASAWYGIGKNTSASTTGLPIGRTQSQTSSDLYFKLQSFGSSSSTSNNAIYGGGTLTITQPTKYKRIALVGATGQGTSNLSITFKYTTGNDVQVSATTAAIGKDWFNNSSIAYTANGRISTEGGNYEYVNSGNPRLYETFFNTDSSRHLQSVTITDSTISDPSQHNVIMAISGEIVPKAGTINVYY